MKGSKTGKTINQSDFDVDKHELFGVKKEAPKKEAPPVKEPEKNEPPKPPAKAEGKGKK